MLCYLIREVDHLYVGCTNYKDLIDSLDNPQSSSAGAGTGSTDATWNDIYNLDAKIKAVKDQIIQRDLEVRKVKGRRKLLAEKMQQAILLNQEVDRELDDLEMKAASAREDEQGIKWEHTRLSEQLHRFMQINVLNDAYYIWFSGPFATINGFRVGKLSNFPQVDWPEINAGLGQAALVVSSIAIKARYSFKNYRVSPMGSFAKINRLDDRRQIFNLYTDGSFSLFASTKKNFNGALIGLLTCVEELGQHVMNLDPTLTLPYEIVTSGTDGKINHLSICYGGDEEQWTKALKFLLTCIKWIIAWSTKHLHYRTTQYDSAKAHLEGLRKQHEEGYTIEGTLSGL